MLSFISTSKLILVKLIIANPCYCFIDENKHTKTAKVTSNRIYKTNSPYTHCLWQLHIALDETTHGICCIVSCDPQMSLAFGSCSRLGSPGSSWHSSYSLFPTSAQGMGKNCQLPDMSANAIACSVGRGGGNLGVYLMPIWTRTLRQTHHSQSILLVSGTACTCKWRSVSIKFILIKFM